MDADLFLRAFARRRMAANGLGIILIDFADWLLGQGYSRNTIHQYTQAVEHFGFWRSRSYPSSRKVKRTEVDEFLFSHLAGCHCPVPAVRTFKTCRAALGRLMAMIDPVSGRSLKPPRSGSIGALIEDFDCHMQGDCGMSTATRLYRRRYAREFLQWRFKRKRLDPGRLSFADFMGYVRIRAAELKPDSCAVMIGSLRAFTRFMEFRGMCPVGLHNAWPSVAQWKKAPPSETLSSHQCRELTKTFDLGSAAGKRDHAIVSLMLELGLRCSEVAALRLEDIDWASGTVAVRQSKQRRERLLPMPHAVGSSISDYLQSGRPHSGARGLFLCHRIPAGDPVTPVRVRGAVRRAMARAGIAHGGTHLLRHTFATELHARGASLKQLSDLLGHQNLDTTAIYARVNLTQLRQVALPWPEASR